MTVYTPVFPPLNVGGALAPPVTIQGTNPATIPLSVTAAPGQAQPLELWTALNGSTTTVQPNGSVQVVSQGANNAFNTADQGLGPQSTLSIQTTGTMFWSGGVAVPDVGLSRGGPGVLNIFGASGSTTLIIGGGNAGAGLAAQILIAPNAGAGIISYQQGGATQWNIYQNTGDSNLYFRDIVNGVMLLTLSHGGGGAFQIAAPTLGFYGNGGTTKPTVTGSKGANAALTSLMTALAGFGLVTDSTT